VTDTLYQDAGGGRTMSRSPVNVLVVDDRPENLLALEELLAEPDRNIIRAGSGNAALRVLLKHEVALVLLDVQMPLMDGYETAQLMRGAEPTRSVPIIFLTAGDRADELAFRGYQLGAVDFLYKPLNPQLLRAKVDVFVELHRQSRELRALNEALERAGAALRDKVADLEAVNRTVSHDLRAPLRSVRGFAQLLADSLAGKLDEEQQHFLRRITMASERMAGMLDDLFSLLRLSAAEESLPDTDCGAVLRDVLEDVRSDVETAGAAVTQDALPRLRANPMLLGQVFQNLIVNAIKFRGPEALRIHVSAERQARGWRFGVRDNGIGIPDDSLERIFDLFSRLGGANLSGTGVGLALCKRAVEKHGGRIWVESTQGQGSTFYFIIPERV
jgi:two-component system, sensor histidine kinase and response regulator